MKSKFNYKRTAMALLVASSALALQACGGGGGGGGGDGGSTAGSPSDAGVASTSGSPAAANGGNTGSISAQFKAGKAPRFNLVSASLQSFGRLDAFTQEAGGAVTRISDTTLTGQTAVRDINGNESFALGRWVAGTVTSKSGAATLTGRDEGSYHYVLYNAADVLPTSGALACDSGTFTSPSRDSGPTSAASTGSASGHASLSFAEEGATVAGAIDVSAGGAAGSASLDVSGLSTTSNRITGSFLGNGGAGASVAVADAGGGAFEVVGSYRAKTPNGAGYIGVYRFVCK